ncbi:unnamed protein product, partial [Chrysoparadoxa australica]
SGNPILFVSLDEEPATMFHWDYSTLERADHSTRDDITNTLVIPSTKLCVDCWISLAVVDFLDEALFTVVAHSKGTSILLT